MLPWGSPADSEGSSELSDSPTVKPARKTARGSTAAQKLAGTSTGLTVDGPVPGKIYYLQRYPQCLPSQDSVDLC